VNLRKSVIDLLFHNYVYARDVIMIKCLWKNIMKLPTHLSWAKRHNVFGIIRIRLDRLIITISELLSNILVYEK